MDTIEPSIEETNEETNDAQLDLVSSMETNNIQQINTQQMSIPTWGVLLVLVLVMIGLKVFIYIKDDKRHNK
ncbi:MAG: hypothetical protein OXB84_09015 [Halobacteriovoraceae bacterium]|nr:hypothetical protein [Halobacteriovoraceae bacterium]